MTDNHLVIHGIGVSAGTASGPAVLVRPAAGVDLAEPGCTNAESGIAKVSEAMSKVSERLRNRAATAPEKSKPILEATAMLAEDRGLLKSIKKKLVEGLGLTKAVDVAVEEYAKLLEAMGGYMAERVTDLYDVRDRTICELRGLQPPGVPDFDQPSVLIGKDLAPAETAILDPELVKAIITEAGGPTSHTAILAAQLGIPAVVQAKGIMSVEPADLVAVDGGVGEIIINPSAEEVEQLAERMRRRAAALAGSSGEGATMDGHRVALLANIGNAEDAIRAGKMDLEGSGLFRTEFMFLDRDQAPTFEEQVETYTQVLQAFGQRRVIVRTLDAGADKPLSFANLGDEENPALGRRGLRLSQAREDLLDTQLDALAEAYRKVGGDLRVMAPMVATVEEATWFAEKVRSRELPKVGVMVEVPAAAIRSTQLLSIVDFASIGTNDLSQYTMAADRMEGALAHLLDPWQPALLQMIKMTCAGGVATGKPIGVCGEAGGDPLLALVLTGLGVGSLSMAPNKVTAVRAALRLHDLSTCQQMAAYAVDAQTSADARSAVESLAHPTLKDLL